MMFATEDGALGSVVVSQIAAGHKNSFRVELCGTERTIAWDQERPEELWVGAREGWTALPRAPELLSPAARPYARTPPATRSATRSASRRLSARPMPRSAAKRRPTGCRCSPTASAPRA